MINKWQFMAQDVLGALNEAYALSKGTKCKQFMYSLSLNPPLGQKVDIDTFEKTLARVQKKLGLEGQPRVVVFHENALCPLTIQHNKRIITRHNKRIMVQHNKRIIDTHDKRVESPWQPLPKNWLMP